MKKLYYLLMLALPVTASAQPVINNALKFDIGATVKNVNCNNVAAGAGGANQTWNFTSLTTASPIDTMLYWYETPPANSPVSGATIRQRNSNDNYFYIKSTAAQDELLCFADSSTDGQGLTVKYDASNLMIMGKRPLTYTMNYTDNFTETYDFMGVTLHGGGSITIEVDGYGTLNLPNGSYPNVLRVKVVQQQTDSVPLIGITGDMNATRYMWFDANHKAPLLRIDSLVVASDAFSNEVYTTEYLAKEHDPVSVNDMPESLTNLRATLHNRLAVTAAFESGKKYELALYNMSGQKLFSTNFIATGSHKEFGYGTNLPGGIYLLSVQEEGHSNAKAIRILKQ